MSQEPIILSRACPPNCLENARIEERKKIAEMLESWMDDVDKPFHKIAQVEKLILRLKKGEMPGGAL